MNSKQPYLKRVLVGLALLCLFIVTIVSLRVPIMRAMGHWLVVNSDTTEPADAVIVLMGSIVDRPRTAAQLYHRQKARKILIAPSEKSPLTALGLVPEDADLTRRLLEFYGVPPTAIQTLPVQDETRTASTRDEADYFRRALAADPSLGRRFYVVTSWYHTRRAAWWFEQSFAGSDIDLRFVSAQNADMTPDNWWASETGFLAVFNEYLKWLHGLLVRVHFVS